MDLAFLAKLALGAVVGGAWVSAATLIGERLDSRIGGLLGGLPSTVLVTYAFIGWTEGAAPAYAATTVFPLTYVIGATSTFLYVLLPARRFALRVANFLALWLLLQLALVLSGFYSHPISLGVWAVFLAILLAYVARNSGRIAQGLTSARPVGMRLTARMALSGTIVASAVLLSKIGGPVLASVFAAFPGVYLSTLVISDRGAGLEFSRSLLALMLVSGSINCVVYVFVFRVLVRDFGPLTATGSAILAVLVSGYVSLKLLKRLVPDLGR